MESFANWSGNTHCCQWATDQSVGLCDWALAIIFQATIINIQQPVEILIFPPYKCHWQLVRDQSLSMRGQGLIHLTLHCYHDCHTSKMAE